jgi:two-component system, NtrC family, nitrogen regulation response regulator GlnG
VQRLRSQTPRLSQPNRKAVIVYLQDSDARRSHAFALMLVRMTGLDVREALPDSAHRNFEGSVCSVVGLSNQFTPADLDHITRMKGSGSIIAVYIDNAASITLGRRCEVLLAGAPVLLDCSSNGFDQQLAQTVSEAVERRNRHLQEEQRAFDAMRGLAIIGRSASILEVFRLAERVSHFSDLPVLLTGETGTGKEVLARAIHSQDQNRCREPFVPLNCAALSRELSESELFGHRKGSFTGAGQDRPGLFRAAHRGILFLDEIGELELSLQAKLLRVLQESSVLRVGDDRETRVDVRVLTATNRDLPKLVAEGAFREDLYHRLNVVLLHIPPLRERIEDIEPLTSHFLQKHGHLSAMHPVTVSHSFIEALEQACLPGNARQLENLVRRALINSGGMRPLDIIDLPSELWSELSSKCAEGCPADRPARLPVGPNGHASFVDDLLQRHNSDLGCCIEECETKLIHAVLANCHGNQAQAARLLGITPRSIYNKLRKPAASASNGKIASA